LTIIFDKKQQHTEVEKMHSEPNERIQASIYLSREMRRINPSLEALKNCLRICERFRFSTSRRAEILRALYMTLIDDGRLVQADQLKQEYPYLARVFPESATEFMLKRNAREQIGKIKCQAYIDQEKIKKCLKHQLEDAKPENRLTKAIENDDFASARQLIELYSPIIKGFMHKKLASMVEVSRKSDKACQWATEMGKEYELALFTILLKYRLGQSKPELIATFYHGYNEETALIEATVRKMIADGCEDYRLLYKLSAIVKGAFMQEITAYCFELIKDWKKGTPGDRAAYTNFLKLVKGKPYHLSS